MYKGVKVNFVIPNGFSEDMCTSDILLAYKACNEHEIETEWVEEDVCLNIELSKNDIYVFDQFHGNAFEHCKKFKKTLIIGTRCLINCLMEGVEIPQVDSPVFTDAMRGVIISTTSFSQDLKDEIVQKCQYMGAFYSSNLTSSVTHLIANCVTSDKYQMAIKTGINVMSKEWVDIVWNESLKRNIHGNDPNFKIYKCPIFNNLVFTTSYIKRNERENLRKLIEDNGGTLSGSLEKGTTNILILEEIKGDKFKYANSWNLPCIKPDYIKDCISHGYALSFDNYHILVKASSSTPKMDTSQQLDPNFSISTIVESGINQINETNFSNNTNSIKKQMLPPELPKSSCFKKVKVNVKEILCELNIRTIKKIGIFLDGCKVYLLGFTFEHREKIRKILNNGGATRLDQLNSAVTHVLVDVERLKKSEENLLKNLSHKPHIVTIEWLVESIKLQHPAFEEAFNIYASAPTPPTKQINEEKFKRCEASPLSKKGHQILQSLKDDSISQNNHDSSSKRVNRKLLDELDFTSEKSEVVTNEEADFSQIYGVNEEKQSSSFQSSKFHKEPEPPRNISYNSSINNDYSTEEKKIFRNFTFILIGIDYSFEQEIENVILNGGGKIVKSNYRELIDYAVLPLELCEIEPKVKNVVNYCWVEHCFEMEHIVDIEYYHKPIKISEDKPLKNCVIAITSFIGKERQFLIDLATFLGACPTEQFSKKDIPSKNVKKATHLLSKDNLSKKYSAALQWGIPVVNYKWLLACAKNNKKMPELKYGINQLDESEMDESLHNSKNKSNETLSQNISKRENLNSSSSMTHFHQSSEKRSSLKKLSTEIEEKSHEEQLKDSSSESSQSPKLLKNHSSTPSSPESHKELPKINQQITCLDKETPVNKRLAKLIIDDCKNSITPPSTRNKRSIENLNVSNYSQSYNHKNYLSDEESPIQTPQINTLNKDFEKYLNKENPETPKWLKIPFSQIKTPETPYGQFLYPNPSPETRKRFKRYIDQVPSIPTDLAPKLTPKNKRRQSTPLSELKRKIWAKFGPNWEQWKDENDLSQYDDNQSEDKEYEHLEKNSEEDISTLSKKEIDGKVGQPGPSTQSQEVLNQLVHLNDILTTPSSKQDGSLRLKRSEVEEEMLSNAASSNENLIMVETEPQVPITWQDPTSNDLILKIKNRCNERQSLTKVNVQLYKFSISGDMALCDDVLSLGGTVSESSTFDNSISHMVVLSLNRTERIMAAIASGKWLVHPQFILKSKEANKFLDEEMFEWGNPKNKENDKLDGSALLVARAAYRWRTHLNKTKETGAFSGMRAFFHTTKSRAEQFQRLIMAGGGEIINTLNPSNNIAGVTHFFVEVKYVKESTIPFTLLANKKIPCLHPSYLSNVLIQTPIPKVEDHYIEEYKKFIPSKS